MSTESPTELLHEISHKYAIDLHSGPDNCQSLCKHQHIQSVKCVLKSVIPQGVVCF